MDSGKLSLQDPAPRASRPEMASPTSSTTTASSGLEDFSYITTGARKASRKNKVIVEDEPLVDTTAALKKKSKKTDRLQKRLQKKQLKASKQPTPTSLLDLPAELVQEVFGYLKPSDLYRLLGVSRDVRDFIYENEYHIARDVIRRRYWVLAQCFPLPVAFEDVDPAIRPALLNDRRDGLMIIHKKPYQHVKVWDPHKICSCMSCVFAWNNLNLAMDLSHWQRDLQNRIPIPMVARGSTPEWNEIILNTHAAVVEKAMTSRLCYAMILEKHLNTSVMTIIRTLRGMKTVHPLKSYQLSLASAEAAKEDDSFLERPGRNNYEFPYHRDNYYGLDVYAPNRKWSHETGKWIYFAEGLHDRDLQWVKERFTP